MSSMRWSAVTPLDRLQTSAINSSGLEKAAKRVSMIAMLLARVRLMTRTLSPGLRPAEICYTQGC